VPDRFGSSVDRPAHIAPDLRAILARSMLRTFPAWILAPAHRARFLRHAHVFCVLALALVALGLAPGSAAAQPSRMLRPWTPPEADSVVAWAAQARALFQTQESDSATGPNQRAFDLVGKIGLRLLGSFQPDEWLQAPVMKGVLDSLKLETDVVVDPLSPQFVLLMVRNPYRRAAEAVGYLYWRHDQRIRYQGVVFVAGMEPRMRVWWTARQEAPYAWGVLSRPRASDAPWRLVLLRLAPSGILWRLVQYDFGGPDFARGGHAAWIDANGDQTPEIIAWSRDRSDSTFEECVGCPGVLVEQLFTEREAGFDLYDSRILPSPWATFQLFVRLLRDGNRAAASRLVQDPARVAEAIAAGWNAPARVPGFRLEYAEPDQAWPRWLAVRPRGPREGATLIVRFVLRDGRWIIREWTRASGAAPSPVQKGTQGK
jgi:hypothetical protein